MEGKLNIAEDFEYIRNQVNYLDNFSKKVNEECKDYFGFKNYWTGIPQDAPIYPHIDKWMVNYKKLVNHIHSQVYEAEIMELVNAINEIPFIRPTISADDVKNFSMAKKILYFTVVPYRWYYNGGKVKQVKAKLKEFAQAVETAKKLVIRLEQHYFYS
ncbi:MAG: hypothetical protein ACKOXB_15195 [Flavobacteriales bacterium]